MVNDLMDSSPDALRQELDSLKAKFADTEAAVPADWRLTAAEERVFRVLLAVDTATRAAISAGASIPETRTIDVHMARIRPKVAAKGVEIETVRCRGWRLVDREVWRRTLQRRAA